MPSGVKTGLISQTIPISPNAIAQVQTHSAQDLHPRVKKFLCGFVVNRLWFVVDHSVLTHHSEIQLWKEDYSMVNYFVKINNDLNNIQMFQAAGIFSYSTI